MEAGKDLREVMITLASHELGFVRGEKGKGRTEENVSAVRGIGWNDASVNQGLSRLAGSSQKPGERH